MINWKPKAKAAAVSLGNLLLKSGHRVVILCYHSVHPTRSFRSVSPDLFEEHLKWLKEHADVLLMRDLVNRRSSPSPTRPQVAITFDDGYVDNYEFAFPLLRKHGLGATFFMTAGYLERDPKVMQWFQQLRQCPMDELEPVNWQQAREMAAGGMEIGAHTYGHPYLVRLSKPELLRELGDSRELMEQKLGSPIEGFAYPWGKPRQDFNETAVEVIKEAGYRYAVTTISRSVRPTDPPWLLPRFFTTQDSVETLKAKVLGSGWDMVGIYQEHLPVWISHKLHRLDIPATNAV